jgi:hypothetical protein
MSGPACGGALMSALLIGAALALLLLALAPLRAAAFGDRTIVDIRTVEVAGALLPRPTAALRLAWEVRQRTSVETRLPPTSVKLSDPKLFESGLVYWSGDGAFAPLSDAEVTGLRRFVEFGGFVMIDDAAPTRADGSSANVRTGFDESIRRELARAFGDNELRKMPATHTVYRSFYLLERPYGRVLGPESLEMIERGGRAAVIYSQHDLGGAWDRDNLGNYYHAVEPGGDNQREMSVRLGVNLVLYALCLDYKDDQVHSPFIMRRRAGQP